MTELVGVLAAAALFALAALLRPRRGCAMDCGACHGACHRLESNDEHA